MSASPQAPWTPAERINLLSSILQGLHVDVSGVLLNAIQERQAQISWEDIVLPQGRTLRSCRNVYDELVRYAQHPRQYMPHGNTTYALAPIMPQLPLQRSVSEQDLVQNQPTQRLIQPRPPRSTDSPKPIATTNGESSFSVLRPSGADLSVERRRKRGRPTKEEAEERDRVLAAEGRTYEPKKRPSKKFRPSIGPGTPLSASETRTVHSPEPQTPLPQTTELHEESSSGKRRSRRLRDEEKETQAVVIEPVSPTKAGQSPSDRLLARHIERDAPPTSFAPTSAITRSPDETTSQPLRPDHISD